MLLSFETIGQGICNPFRVQNIEQYVCGPTHNLGHTLDLVLSRGLLISNMEVIEACVSDHYPVLFESECFDSSPIFAQHSHLSRVINSYTANVFPEHYSYMSPMTSLPKLKV